MNLSKDWLAFLEDGVARPSGHFAALLAEDENWKDPGALFSSFPKSTSLTKRLNTLAQDFKGSGRYFIPDPAMRASREEMRQLVSRHVSVLADLGQDEGEVEDAAAIRTAPINFVETHDAFSDVMRDHNRLWNELPDVLDDVYMGLMNRTDRRYRFINEAVLELTKSKEVTMWVMSDFVGLNLDLKPGYEIFRRGGVTAFPRDETVVCIF